MSRPAVAVILPFAGSPAEAEDALDALSAIDRAPDDALVIVDNTGRAVVPARAGITVVAADQERSAYHARNAGVAAAPAREWLLFVDGDCRPSPDLIDRYFEPVPEPRCGAVVGEIVGAENQPGLVPRYARARRHLGQEQHFNYPFRPFGVTANLLVRRVTWEDVGGFCEGIRSTGDVEICWRMQDAGWTVEFRPSAIVEHRHRDSLRALVRQAARYGAGQAWIRRRYPAGMEQPAIAAVLCRAAAGTVLWTITGRFERGLFKAIDALYAVSGWTAAWLPNRPPGLDRRATNADVVVVAKSWPDSAIESPVPLGGHVEALARPVRIDRAARLGVQVAYAEDDCRGERALAILWFMWRYPRRVAAYARHARGMRRLADVACPARRTIESRARRVMAADSDSEHITAGVRILSGLAHA